MKLPQHIIVTKLQADTRILIETENCVWAFKVIDPEAALVEVYGTDPQFKDGRPVTGQLVEAVGPVEGNLEHALVKGWKFLVRFANIMLVGGPVTTARIQGPTWSYEAIE